MPVVNRFDYMLQYVCSEVREVREFTVLYRDVFSMALVYNLMFEWLQDRGYGYSQPWEVLGPKSVKQKDGSGPNDMDFPEIQYVHKELSFGTEIWLRWRCQKIEPNYPHWAKQMDIDIHVLGLKPTEVVVNGKKITADKGEIEIAVKTYLLIDPGKKIQNHSFFKHFYKAFFDGYYRGKTEELEEQLVEEADEFRTALKEYFKLPSYKDVRTLSQFHPRRDEAT